MTLKYPDYENSILNLACSIINYYNLETQHSTLSYVDKILKNNYKNVVTMVLDGMGTKILRENLSEDSFLRKNFRKEITSVFPPTTTAATTTLTSGLSPIEHGWLGWSLYFKAINENINLYINTNDIGIEVTDYHVANRYIPYKSIVDRINETEVVKAHYVSPFGSTIVNNIDEFCRAIKKICNNNETNYVYAYWPQPDSTMHFKGCYSETSKHILEEIDTKLEDLCNQLEDTLLIITADHGHIDGKSRLILDYPDLLNTLERLPSIEPRALSFFVKEGMDETFKALFNHYFKETFLLVSKNEILEMKLFGENLCHTKNEAFIGDYIAIATSDVALYNTKEDCEKFIGVHAGLTEDEMKVPLIMIECKKEKGKDDEKDYYRV